MPCGARGVSPSGTQFLAQANVVQVSLPERVPVVVPAGGDVGPTCNDHGTAGGTDY